ncbi:hypothetical protein G4B88_030268 [Cannabis sativa]|uniref:Uncharacterized protein n=1 Tax=Cannabis sativa TaxID=3483 RepID=A0A7J6GEH6_CANSA|nr:hypothetical protein G4B88_030267 [Cannabis sativa]KAF4381361.1 hypothetical protein G4B88_030268 [Cannabis sativa]
MRKNSTQIAMENSLGPNLLTSTVVEEITFAIIVAILGLVLFSLLIGNMQYKWIATSGIDEEAILKDFPVDLRRDIKRHVCLDLVRQVLLFDQMDEKMLDAIRERLKPSLSTVGTCHKIPKRERTELVFGE